MILSGRVMVNGKPVTELGTKADPDRDHIRVDGKLIAASQQKIYLLLNKPRGYVTTTSDPEHRPTVMDLVQRGAHGQRIYPIGRLDWNSEGLLLLTNDGELANQVTRAASNVRKTYLVKVSGRPSEENIARLRAGIRITQREPGSNRITSLRTAPAVIQLIKDAPNPWYEIVLREGRNRQIHRMFEQIGHHVEKIKRVKYGPLELDVPPGEFRKLSENEVAALRRAAGMEAPAKYRAGAASARSESSRVIKRKAR
jgi:23S rRNA pseudouridine2605 synthase